MLSPRMSATRVRADKITADNEGVRKSARPILREIR
jgi:hypothetical protein